MSFVSFLKVAFCVALLLCCSFDASPQSIEAGKVVERVVLQSQPNESYAVYLPTSYTTEKSWPTIFCFDPRARGKFALERFVEAAETHGYIVLCSNNSRNGLNW